MEKAHEVELGVPSELDMPLHDQRPLVPRPHRAEIGLGVGSNELLHGHQKPPFDETPTSTSED